MIEDKEWKDAPSLPSDFFDRQADIVAPDLIGCYVFVESDGYRAGGMIVETEAYDQLDYASHCYSDEHKKARPDSGPMSFTGGNLYLYWNKYWPSLNFVCDRPGFGSAVLIRAIEPASATEAAIRRRRELLGPTTLTELNLCNGPQNIGQALGLGNDLYKQSQLDPVSLFKAPFDLRNRRRTREIVCGPRIGIAKQLARESKDQPIRGEARVALSRYWRFGLAGSKFLSRSFTEYVLKDDRDRRDHDGCIKGA